MGNTFCCCQIPKSKIIVQNDHHVCERCEHRMGEIKSITPLYLEDDLKNDNTETYLIFICDRGHLFELHGDKTYLRWILSNYHRHKTNP